MGDQPLLTAQEVLGVIAATHHGVPNRPGAIPGVHCAGCEQMTRGVYHSWPCETYRQATTRTVELEEAERRMRGEC